MESDAADPDLTFKFRRREGGLLSLENATMPRPRQRVCLQDGQRLDINQLRRTGVMPRDLEGQTAGSLVVRFPEIGFEQTIRFASRKRHYGGRQFYFVCPATGRLASVIWRPPGANRFCSRQAWGRQVAYQTQFAEPSARAHLAKAKIRAKLCEVGGWCEPEGWEDMPPRPKRMRAATYARWETRFEDQERNLDNALLFAWRTKWAVLKGMI